MVKTDNAAYPLGLGLRLAGLRRFIFILRYIAIYPLELEMSNSTRLFDLLHSLQMTAVETDIGRAAPQAQWMSRRTGKVIWGAFQNKKVVNLGHCPTSWPHPPPWLGTFFDFHELIIDPRTRGLHLDQPRICPGAGIFSFYQLSTGKQRNRESKQPHSIPYQLIQKLDKIVLQVRFGRCG